MTIRPKAVLNETQVVQILTLANGKTSYKDIATQYSVSTKTISRICNGETWKEISQQYNVQPKNRLLPSIPITSLSPDMCDLLDEVTAVKNCFGLAFHQPIYWGWFESWDGLHSVAGDGYILWESEDLVEYARKILATNIREYPVWASKAEELPTFELEDLLSQPVGECYTLDRLVDKDTARLISRTRKVLIPRKYVNIANRLKLNIREAGDSSNYIYMTKNKPKAVTDPIAVVVACAVALQEVTHAGFQEFCYS